MMLNPPIALFDEEDRQMFNPGMDTQHQSNEKLVQNTDYYPDFLRENQQMTDQINQVISEKRPPHHINLNAKRSRVMLFAAASSADNPQPGASPVYQNGYL